MDTTSTGRASREAILQQLNLLSTRNLSELTAYAGRRLGRVGLNPDLADEITQDALYALLLGLKFPGQGRHPRDIDVKTTAAFLDYLGGVINSLVTVARRKEGHALKHVPLRLMEPNTEAQPIGAELVAQECVAAEVAWSDLEAAFFSRLMDRTEPTLRPHLHEWRISWRSSDRIPLPVPKRRLRKRLKRFSQEVLTELGEQLLA